MKIPNPEKAIVSQRKILDYLLSVTHPIGRFKAKIFADLGYGGNRWIELRKDLAGFLDMPAIRKENGKYGGKHEIGEF